MAGLAIITGLDAEAAILRTILPRHGDGAGTVLRVAGPGPARAAAAARDLIERGAGALMSFGFAAGLDPALRAGTLIVADEVVHGGCRLSADAAWRDRLAEATGAIVASIVGVDAVLVDEAAKRSLFGAVGAAAADMESHAVAGAAVSAGLPFVVVRAVADPAWRAVPRSALAALAPDGRVRILPALAGIAVRPGEVADLIRLARDSRAAAASLRRVAAFAGPGFGLV